MVYRLKRHPLPIQAFFRHSLVLTYAVPQRVVTPMLPPGLTADCFGDWAFLAVAMVQTEQLRPAGLPGWLGQSFFLTGYRIFTRFHAANGKVLRGLKILRSDTNRDGMRRLGNLFTHYGYRKVQASVEFAGDSLSVEVTSPDGISDVKVRANLGVERLPEGSVFESFREARRFAGPMPFTFDYESQTRSMVVVEGVRPEWNPRLVEVDVERLGFLDQSPFAEAHPILSSAFYLHDVRYRWKPGVVMKIAANGS